MANTILVMCAHPDDEVFGMGATAAKYSRAGKKIIPVIFSLGEQSDPWTKREFLIPERKKESSKAARILGYLEPIYLDIPEAELTKRKYNRKDITIISEIIKKYRPESIFTHSINDPHPGHRAIKAIVSEALKKSKYKGPVYTFDIWNPIRLKRRNKPKLMVDVSKTFKLKIKALKTFETQKISLMSLLWSVYARAIINGFLIKVKYAEKFTKIQ